MPVIAGKPWLNTLMSGYLSSSYIYALQCMLNTLARTARGTNATHRTVDKSRLNEIGGDWIQTGAQHQPQLGKQLSIKDAL